MRKGQVIGLCVAALVLGYALHAVSVQWQAWVVVRDFALPIAIQARAKQQAQPTQPPRPAPSPSASPEVGK